jgi:hypothetical protein
MDHHPLGLVKNALRRMMRTEGVKKLGNEEGDQAAEAHSQLCDARIISKQLPLEYEITREGEKAHAPEPN